MSAFRSLNPAADVAAVTVIGHGHGHGHGHGYGHGHRSTATDTATATATASGYGWNGMMDALLMKPDPSHRRMTLWILAAMVLLSGPSIVADVGQGTVLAEVDPIIYFAFQECQDCPEVQVVARTLPGVTAIQQDVAIGDRVVSFISAQGVGQRAWCEMVYLDESSWFGACSVFEFAYDSWAELIDTLRFCENCNDLERYAFRANDAGCGPTLTAEGRGSAAMRSSGLQWAVELTDWVPEDVALLGEALKIVGSHGCPILGHELTGYFAIEAYGILPEDFHPVDEVPESMSLIMGHEQLNGLAGLLKQQTDDMGSPNPGVGPADWFAPPEGVEVSTWRGAVSGNDEEFLVDATSVVAEGVALIVGGVQDPGGTTMAFVLPSPGERLATSTWGMTSLDVEHSSNLWSDGRCEYLDIRREGEPNNLVEAAPWLGWCASPSDFDALQVLRDSGDESWALEEILFGLEGFNPRRGVEVSTDVVHRESEEEPKMLEECWDEILFRYIETRERLRRVDELPELVSGRQDPS